MSHEHELFNTCLSKARVHSEACIGILKGRFQWLKSMRKLITEDIESKLQLLTCLDATFVLHNLLLSWKEGKLPEDWLIDDDEVTAIGGAELEENVDLDNELNVAVPLGSPTDMRRQQLLHHVLETHFES